jgi:hypothetical protein
MGPIGEFLAEGLHRLDLAQALGTLQNMGLKLVLCGGIELPIEVFFCDVVPMQLLTLHSLPR